MRLPAPRSLRTVLASSLLALCAGLPPLMAFAAPAGDGPPRAPLLTDRYFIQFREQPLATYDGGVAGLPVPGQIPETKRLDVHSEPAKRYVAFLQNQQQGHRAAIETSLGRALNVRRSMQHVMNGMVVQLTPAEARTVAGLPDVQRVKQIRALPVNTDTGPLLIGAKPVWDGMAVSGTPLKGEGTVIGVIDGGINFASPSFAALDPVDGYIHVNPLGSGNYLGTCAPGQSDAGRCNDKLIGAYDFICGAPSNMCGVPDVWETPSADDGDDHGPHVASTVAGNHRSADLFGLPRDISGVAPRANVIAFDVCYEGADGGWCTEDATVAAVDQAIADGLVNTINYSISGGELPWSDIVSLAFLNAVDAGIYVATSAGNSGPDPYTLGHVEPWTASTAAAQHGRSGLAYPLAVTGPGVVPPALSAMQAVLGEYSMAHLAPLSGPLVVSPTFLLSDDGCAPFAPNTFAGAVALVRRGECTFSTKVTNAVAAGAVAVLIGNNNAGLSAPSVPGVTVEVFMVSQADGLALRDWALAHVAPTPATLTIGYPGIIGSNTPDMLAGFSSRGPAFGYDVIKPSITAPGVDILAALGDAPASAGLMSGTSMASPHHAGASLLVKQARPTWTPLEIRSALEMTAYHNVLKEDGTPATPFDMGSGRVRVDQAVNAGLVLHETKANFEAADPELGGNVSALNLASMARNSCPGTCQFVRTFRNTLATSQSWNAQVLGLPGSVSPSSFTVAPGASVSLTITINGAQLPQDGNFQFGWLGLQAQGGGTPDLTLPIAIRAGVPAVVSAVPSLGLFGVFGLVSALSILGSLFSRRRTA